MTAGRIDAANPALDRLIVGTFALGLAAAAILSVFGHRGVAPCVGLMALAVALRRDVWAAGFGLLSPRRAAADPLSIAFVAMISFTLWVAVSALWSPTPGGVELGFTVFISVLAGGAISFEALRSPSHRLRRLALFFVASMLVASAALLFEGLSGAYLRNAFPPDDLSPQRIKDFTALGRGVTAMTPLVFPAAVLLRRMSGSWLIASAPVLSLLAAASCFSIFANVAALVIGGFAFLAAFAFPRTMIGVLTGLAIVALLAAPFIASHLPVDFVLNGDAAGWPVSWAQRLFIWKEAGRVTLTECLPLGCGADFSRALSAKGATVAIPGWPTELPVFPIHPHNVFLQVWMELGLPGVAALAIAFAASGAALLRIKAERSTFAAAAAAIAAAFISVMFEASLWQVWRLAVFALAALGCSMSYCFRNLK